MLYRGVGKWILKQMQGFFDTDSDPSGDEELTKKGNLCNIHIDKHKYYW